jgi:predicted Holliday junction resolvase-like endonuclease
MPSLWATRLIILFSMAIPIFEMETELPMIFKLFCWIKSGGARLTKGQQAIAQAIKEGKVRFETLRIDFED